ncbi:hypothetical protein, partial [Pseudofrankia sp. BMG5.36]|uniref:hypothetical protein n=1 Tax=Pseudofrankia sp. BMG5.36 TaxID=1834512 RepID=UPI001A7E128B
AINRTLSRRPVHARTGPGFPAGAGCPKGQGNFWGVAQLGAEGLGDAGEGDAAVPARAQRAKTRRGYPQDADPARQAVDSFGAEIAKFDVQHLPRYEAASLSR